VIDATLVVLDAIDVVPPVALDATDAAPATEAVGWVVAFDDELPPVFDSRVVKVADADPPVPSLTAASLPPKADWIATSSF
jgi:hypothetical protein